MIFLCNQHTVKPVYQYFTVQSDHILLLLVAQLISELWYVTEIFKINVDSSKDNSFIHLCTLNLVISL